MEVFGGGRFGLMEVGTVSAFGKGSLLINIFRGGCTLLTPLMERRLPPLMGLTEADFLREVDALKMPASVND